jgi:hypothetical protein
MPLFSLCIFPYAYNLAEAGYWTPSCGILRIWLLGFKTSDQNLLALDPTELLEAGFSQFGGIQNSRWGSYSVGSIIGLRLTPAAAGSASANPICRTKRHCSPSNNYPICCCKMSEAHRCAAFLGLSGPFCIRYRSNCLQGPILNSLNPACDQNKLKLEAKQSAFMQLFSATLLPTASICTKMYKLV